MQFPKEGFTQQTHFCCFLYSTISIPAVELIQASLKRNSLATVVNTLEFVSITSIQHNTTQLEGVIYCRIALRANTVIKNENMKIILCCKKQGWFYMSIDLRNQVPQRPFCVNRVNTCALHVSNISIRVIVKSVDHSVH